MTKRYDFIVAACAGTAVAGTKPPAAPSAAAVAAIPFSTSRLAIEPSPPCPILTHPRLVRSRSARSRVPCRLHVQLQLYVAGPAPGIRSKSEWGYEAERIPP